MSETQEKRLYALVLILVVAVSLLSGFALYMSFSKPPQVVTQPPGTEPKIISVSGVGTVTMIPDIGWFVATVSTQAGTAAQAEQQNNDAMTEVISALKNVGIEDSNIQTTDYSLSPIYVQPKDQGQMPLLVGYSARHSIRVTVNDLAKVGKMIDLAISNGANEVGSVYFGLSKAKEQEAQTHALDLAVKDANSKAKTIADAIEAKLVGPTSVSLGYSYMPNMPIRMESNTAQPASIQPGQLEYTVNVQITYAFS